MKEKVLKALWWAWMLLPIGLACFVLPIPCFGVWVLITTGDPEALYLLIPVVFSVIMYIFYRHAVQCSGFVALHAAAWNLVGWLQLSMLVEHIANLAGKGQSATPARDVGEVLILGGLQCILWLIIVSARKSKAWTSAAF